jgi:hypothetical protein
VEVDKKGPISSALFLCAHRRSFPEEHDCAPGIGEVMVGRMDPYFLAGDKEILSVLQACVDHPIPFLVVDRRKPDGLQIEISVQYKKEMIITRF